MSLTEKDLEQLKKKYEYDSNSEGDKFQRTQDIHVLISALEKQNEALNVYGNKASWGTGICTNVMVKGVGYFSEGWKLAKAAIIAKE